MTFGMTDTNDVYFLPQTVHLRWIGVLSTNSNNLHNRADKNMKFSGMIDLDLRDIHAQGQRSRSRS